MECRSFRLQLVAACAFGVAGAAQASESSLGLWQDYALHGIMPAFDWANARSRQVAEPSVLDAFAVRTSLAPQARLDLPFADQGFSVAIVRSLAGDTPLFESGDLVPQRLGGAGVGLERTWVTPALTRSVGESTELTAGVVLVQQEFASWGFGAGVRTYNDAVAQAPASLLGTSSGSGIRLGLRQALNDDFELQANYQSGIDLSELQNYRGIYSRPGDFDLPAVVGTDLSWKVAASSRLRLGVSRVMYSEVAPFASAALPVRFLSLLGDGASPTFAWRDLTVARLDWEWAPSGETTLGLHYATRQQPEPADRRLRDALADEFTDNNFGFSLTQQLRGFGSLRFAASYAPVQYFLGNASFGSRDASGEQLEVEAVWALPF